MFLGFKNKLEKLISDFNEYAKSDIIVAFSGGVDSSLILKLACDAAKKSGKKVYGVTLHTELHPMKDIEIAKRVSEELAAENIIIYVDELKNAGIINNPKDRCYLCKKYLFSKIIEIAKEKNIDVILEGTNADDLQMYRPGIRALKELKIISPFADNNISKSDIRNLAQEYGVSVASRPSTPCLATRFPYGTKLTYEELEKVERAEEYLRGLGFYNVRLRIHGDIVRIEVDHEDMDKLINDRKQIINYLKKIGYIYITLDLEGFRSGSMDYKIR